MDSTTTILGLSLFFISMAPIVFVIISKSKKNKKLQVTFNDLAKRHALNFTEKENWNDKIIGIDNVNKKLLYISPLLREGELIDLKKVISYKIGKEAEQIPGKKEVVTKLSLQLEVKDPAKRQLDLLFYDADKDDLLQVAFHHALISKWHGLVADAVPVRQRVNA